MKHEAGSSRGLRLLLLALLGCAGAGACRGESRASGPQAALDAFVGAARSRDVAAARGHLTTGTIERLARFDSLSRAIDATSVPRDIFGAILGGFASERPEVLESRVEAERAECLVRYRQGRQARLAFRREDDAWKLDLEEAMKPAIELLEGAGKMRGAAERGEIVVRDDD